MKRPRSLALLVPLALAACSGLTENARPTAPLASATPAAPAACLMVAQDDRGIVSAFFASTVGAIRELPAVATFVTLNLQASYTGFEGLTLSLGVENALDEEVPFAIGDGDVDVYGYVQNVHSPRGRFVYGKATYRF